MASLNVSQDDMIDILIGHANVGIPLNAPQSAPLANQERSYTGHTAPINQEKSYISHDAPTHQDRLYNDQNAPHMNQARLYTGQTASIIQGKSYPSLNAHTSQDRSYQESYTGFNSPIPPQQMHNQYLCPGCRKSILYTNRSSLVQLLSLHQQKCAGSLEYRYMCLDCHNAFKTVVQLQNHETACRKNANVNRTDALDKPHKKNSIDTGTVIQSLPPGNIFKHGTHSQTQNTPLSDTTDNQAKNLMSPDGHVANPVQQSYRSQVSQEYNREKFSTEFYNSSGEMSGDHDKNSVSTGGVIQNILTQQSYGPTPDIQNNDYKFSSSLYHPDTIDNKVPPQNSVTTGGVIQSTAIQQLYPQAQDGYNASGIITQQPDGTDVKSDTVIHSMSEQSYEQPQRVIDDSCKVSSQNLAVVSKNTGESSNQESKEPVAIENIPDQKIFVRETWTQTYKQPEKEIVEVLLDEISPAGRKRRMCTRRMKVYNEKELAEQREHTEIQLLKLSSRWKRAKVVKKEPKVLAKEKIKKEKKVKPIKVKKDKTRVKDTPKLPKKKKERKEKKKPKEKEPELAIPIQCQLCTKTYTRYSLYTKHYQMFHERVMCQYCGSQCIRRKLKSHEASHLKTFKCPYPGCTKVLNSNHRLVRHSRVHTGEKPYTCDLCHKPFAGKENMVKHKKRVHDGEKPYQCRYCGRKFADTGRLKYHEGTHTKPRPTDYRCKFCGRGYKSHVGCYLHERTHTGNTVKCQYCGKAFMAKEHLRRHEYIHTGNYPFRCGNCQKGFKDNSSMKKHKCLAVL